MFQCEVRRHRCQSCLYCAVQCSVIFVNVQRRHRVSVGWITSSLPGPRAAVSRGGQSSGHRTGTSLSSLTASGSEDTNAKVGLVLVMTQIFFIYYMLPIQTY